MNEEKIDQYLMGLLSGDELTEMESAIRNDENLSAVVEERRAMFSVIDGFGDIEMADKINVIHKEEVASYEQKALRRKRNYIIAIAAILLLALACCFWFWQSPKDNSALYADYYSPYEINFNTRNTDDINANLLKATAAYSEKNYNDAEQLFEDYLAKDDTDSKVRLALGICKMETGKYDQALQHFTYLTQLDFDRYKEQAAWYAALTHIKNNDSDKAKPFLLSIVKNNRPPLNKKAKELLYKL